MNNFINKYYLNKPVTLALVLLTTVGSKVFAQPKIVTNPSGKSITQVSDGFFDYFFSEVRPILIVFIVLGGGLGAWVFTRLRFAILGTMIGLLITLMALPTIIARIYQMM